MLLVNATNFPLRDPSVRSAEIPGGARAYLFDDVARVAGFDDWRPAVEAGNIRYKQMASLILPGLANANKVFGVAFPVVDYPTALNIIWGGRSPASRRFADVMESGGKFPKAKGEKFQASKDLIRVINNKDEPPPTWRWEEIAGLQPPIEVVPIMMGTEDSGITRVRWCLPSHPGAWSLDDAMVAAGLDDRNAGLAAIESASGWTGRVLVLEDGEGRLLPVVNDTGFYAIMARGTSSLARRFQAWAFGDLMATLSTQNKVPLSLSPDLFPIALGTIRDDLLTKRGLKPFTG